MKINIRKVNAKGEDVSSGNFVTLYFEVKEYPNYTLLHTELDIGVITKTTQNENYIIIEVSSNEPVAGSAYIYYVTETSVQDYIEFTDNDKCVNEISIDNLRVSRVSEELLIDRVSPYGQVLTYKIRFKDVAKQCEIITILLPEDVYLLEPDKTVCIKYNPEVSSLKRNYVDVITPTLGNETPFIRRAGQQKYKTFTLGGLISIEAEEEVLFGAYSLLNRADRKLLDIIDDIWIDRVPTANLPLSPYDVRAAKERLYRERLLDFLEDGKVKLFKSVQEGNIWVYLSGVTLTADKTSTRNLYSFSCTATEVAPEYALYGVEEVK